MDLESGRIAYFTEDHVRLLTLLAPQIASSVENARLHSDISQRERRMQDDLIAARNVQSILLPRKAPTIEGLEIGIALHPAREISGDLYDFFEYSADEAVIVFGDSSGKGAAAALYGSLVSGLLRILAPRGKGPARLMHSLNETLLERKIDAQYVTLFIMLWQAQARSLTMANAGALPPLVCRRGELIKPRVEGVPLGLLGDQTYEEVHFPAEPGDVIALYSDGITDALNIDGEEYGRRRLGDVVVSHCVSAANEIVDAVLADVNTFSSGAAAFDDQTLIILKVQ
jgi:sigma-B regulation protein RsbU (phosphoserine phosphatase)